MTDDPVRELSHAQIHALVEQWIEQGGALDLLLEDAIFGPGPRPATWGEYPEQARAAWTMAVIYADTQLGRDQYRKSQPLVRSVTLGEAWDAVEASGRAHPTVRLAWPDISQRLRIGGRSAQYWLHRLGFRFVGRPGSTKSPRRLVQAPCRQCGKVLPYRGSDTCTTCSSGS